MLFSVATAAGVLPAALWKEGAEKPGLHYGFRMRSAPALLIGAVVALTLVACVPEDEPVRPDPSPTAEPIFASDEEALAAAEEAYGAFLTVSGEILSQGGAEPGRLLAVATQEVYEAESESYAQFAEQGWHSEGVSFVDSVTLQAVDNYAFEGDAAVTVYACLDVSDTDVFDSTGRSVVSENRPDRTPFETTFAYAPSTSSLLILSEKTVWSGDNFCG